METTVAALEQRLADATDPVEKSDTFSDLINEIWPRHLDRALALAEAACENAQATGDPALITRALETYGYLLRQKADYPRAMTTLLEALNLAQVIKDRAREAGILNTMASLSHDLGNYPESLTYYYKTLAIAQSLQDSARQACVLNDIGFVYLLLNQPGESLPYLRESLAISQRCGYESIEAAALDSLGQVYYQLGDYDESLIYAQRCQALAQQAGLLRSEIEVSITMGKTYAALGQFSKALSHFNDALSLAREAGRRNDEVGALVEIGKVYLRQRDPVRALARLGTALSIAEKNGKKQSLYEIHQALADIYAQAGDYRRAFAHYQAFHTLKEEVFNNQADHRIKSLQNTHKVEQAHQRAEIYELKNVELQRQIAEKERLIADLDAFASMVAHDLKNPLAVVIANAELIVRDDETVLSDYAQECTEDLLHMGYKMGNVIDDLLVLAGVRREDLAPEPLRMETIVPDVYKRLARLIKQREATILAPEEWPVAMGHAGLIEEVWVNYISNAIKYGGDPPVVELGAMVQPDGLIRYWVRDNGDGIQPDQQSCLFTDYTRLNRNQSTDGTGLGLTIVKRIMDRLGGEVSVTSAGVPGDGCLFAFTLPAADGHQAED
ncbi:MAG: tetratricopeptide repeat protein [Anaerolineae bacterium]|nr:tetratricopeptide repeat protein [Anaerolineae bacterium]